MKIENSNITNRAWISPFLLTGMVVTYTLILGAWAVNRFMSFNATIWDLGLMTQTIWNTAHGRILYESVNLGFPISRLAVAHWELIYFPLVVIYRIIPSVPLLLYIQTFVLACGIFPIYRFAEKKLSSKNAAICIAAAYLFYPALHGANLFDLHGLTFATTFLLFTFYFLEQDSFSLTLIFGFLSLSCREDVAFSIFMLGLYSMIFKKEKKIGIIFITLSMFWIIAFTFRGYLWGAPEIIKAIDVTSNWNHFREGGIFPGLLNQPLHMLHFLIQPVNLKYLAKLLIPVFGFSLFAPRILYLALPALLLNMFSDWGTMHQIEYHYTATITPFIFLAAIQGISNFSQWINRLLPSCPKRLHISSIVAGMVLLSSLISTTQFSIVRFHKNWQVSEGNRMLAKQLKEIPSDLSVSATARAGVHLAARSRLFHFPDHATDAEIVVIELNRPEVEIKNFSGKSRTQKAPAMNAWTQIAMQDTSLGLRFAVDHVFCLQRGIDSQKSFADEAIHDSIPANSYQITNVNLGHGLFLLGWKFVYLSSEQAHFLLCWSIQQQQSVGTKLSFYLQSDNWIAEIDHRPIFGRLKLEEWSAGEIYCDHLFIDRPESSDWNTFTVMVRSSQNHHAALDSLFTFSFPAND